MRLEVNRNAAAVRVKTQIRPKASMKTTTSFVARIPNWSVSSNLKSGLFDWVYYPLEKTQDLSCQLLSSAANPRMDYGFPRRPNTKCSYCTSRLNIHDTAHYYSEPQWKDTLLPSFLTCSSGTTTMTFSGASLPVE